MIDGARSRVAEIDPPETEAQKQSADSGLAVQGIAECRPQRSTRTGADYGLSFRGGPRNEDLKTVIASQRVDQRAR